MGHSEKHIAPLLLGGIIAAGASLAGNAIGSASQSKTNETSKDIAEKMWGMNNAYNSPNDRIYRDWETDRKSTRLNSSHRSLSRMPSSA